MSARIREVITGKTARIQERWGIELDDAPPVPLRYSTVGRQFMPNHLLIVREDKDGDATIRVCLSGRSITKNGPGQQQREDYSEGLWRDLPTWAVEVAEAAGVRDDVVDRLRAMTGATS